jgi:hypothetical protein
MRRQFHFAVAASLVAALGIVIVTATGGAPARASHSDDFANDVSDATLLALPAEIVGAIEADDDVDVFLVELVQDTSYLFHVKTSGSLNAALELRDAGGNLVASNEDCTSVGCVRSLEAALDVTASTTGTHSLTVRPVGLGGGYTLNAKSLVAEPLVLAPSVTSRVDGRRRRRCRRWRGRAVLTGVHPADLAGRLDLHGLLRRHRR